MEAMLVGILITSATSFGRLTNQSAVRITFDSGDVNEEAVNRSHAGQRSYHFGHIIWSNNKSGC